MGNTTATTTNDTPTDSSLDPSQQQYYTCQLSPLTSSLTKQETSPYTSTSSPVGLVTASTSSTSKRLVNDPTTFQRKQSKLAHVITTTTDEEDSPTISRIDLISPHLLLQLHQPQVSKFQPPHPPPPPVSDKIHLNQNCLIGDPYQCLGIFTKSSS
ncbi:unnamed protein product [Absidia cylindrospora]